MTIKFFTGGSLLFRLMILALLIMMAVNVAFAQGDGYEPAPTSRLAGIALPKGTINVTLKEIRDQVVPQLDIVADKLKSQCARHEILFVAGPNQGGSYIRDNPLGTLSAIVGAMTKAGYTYHDLDAAGSAMKPFTFKGKEQQFAGYWVSTDDFLVFAWCQLNAVVHNPADRPLAPGNPPLTRQVADALTEMFAFTTAEATGQPFEATAEFKDSMAQLLASNYHKLPAAQHELLAQAAKRWAVLRASWPYMGEENRAELRRQWRETLQKAVPRPKEQVEAEKSLHALQALISTGQRRPLQPAELNSAANHMEVVAVALRQLGGEENASMAAQLAQQAQAFRTAAQQVTQAPSNQAPAKASSYRDAQLLQTRVLDQFRFKNMINFMSGSMGRTF